MFSKGVEYEHMHFQWEAVYTPLHVQPPQWRHTHCKHWGHSTVTIRVAGFGSGSNQLWGQSEEAESPSEPWREGGKTPPLGEQCAGPLKVPQVCHWIKCDLVFLAPYTEHKIEIGGEVKNSLSSSCPIWGTWRLSSSRSISSTKHRKKPATPRTRISIQTPWSTLSVLLGSKAVT